MTHGVGCLLQGPELTLRINEWRSVAARATSFAVLDDTVTSTYPREAGLLAELRRLIEAERNCCSHMKIRLEESSQEAIVTLQAPKEMRHLLSAMFKVTQ